jgi:hypothetical protein
MENGLFQRGWLVEVSKRKRQDSIHFDSVDLVQLDMRQLGSSERGLDDVNSPDTDDQRYRQKKSAHFKSRPVQYLIGFISNVHADT